MVSIGLKPHLSIVDMKTRRNDISPKLVSALIEECNIYRVTSPPGKISLEAINLICRLLEKTELSKCYIIIVDGEEDMLALPTLSCAPEGSAVIYGVPGIGIAVFLTDNAIRYLASNRLLYLEPVECM
ncbi:MAG: GTP-dependent dephospho-CoA kinase family protein [Desulfurococcales archaeon]|nr:GTP-dependent dephospho-CoA kinase family protein [Desulfurococcales archaeon]